MRLLLSLALSAFALSAGATPTVVQNGGFEDNTGAGQLGFNTSATGWNVDNAIGNGYAFLFAPGTADNGGTNGQYGSLSLYGPNNGANNGLPAASPFGGYYVGIDGAFQDEAVYQVLNTVAGHHYQITFAYAGAQQFGFNGNQTESVVVNLGPSVITDAEYQSGQLPSTAQQTAVLQNSSHGFTGWHTASFTFTAQTNNDILSFLAENTPQGVPPFTLIDGVTGTAVPEPGAIALLGLGGLGLVAVSRRRG